MVLLKLLLAINLIAWFLPAFVFRKHKYSYFFLIKSLIDPVYFLVSELLNVNIYNFIPIALLCELASFPLIDSRFRTISVTALLFLSITAGKDWYLELIICESILSLMMYSLLKDALEDIINKSILKIYHPLLLSYFLRNAILYYLYYYDYSVLHDYYSLLLIPVVILPFLIAHYGPEKNIVFGQKYFHSFSTFPLYNTDIARGEENSAIKKNGLTEREYEIIRLVGRGYTNKEIAEKLFLSKSSIDHSRVIIKEKLNISKRSEYNEFIDNHIHTNGNNRSATKL